MENQLTDRQGEIYVLAQSGHTRDEIARYLDVSIYVVDNDLHAIRKLGLQVNLKRGKDKRNQNAVSIIDPTPKAINGHTAIGGKTINLVDTLNAKEKEAYDLLLLGLTNEDIGERLDITSYAVLKRLRNVYKKLGIESANRHDMYSARQRAIAYGGTKIEQSVTVSQSGYSENQIRFAAMKLVSNEIYDSKLVNGFVADLMLVLEKKI